MSRRHIEFTYEPLLITISLSAFIAQPEAAIFQLTGEVVWKPIPPPIRQQNELHL